MSNLTIQYRFTFGEGIEEVFDITLDETHLTLVSDSPQNPPEWTRLDFHQCPNCPLALDSHPFCPQATSLLTVVSRFEGILSHDRVHVDVVTKERRISQETTAQRGISSLLGLVIASSGCPHTVYFRPMARFHLPLASEEETIYRATSMYLLAQYFLKKTTGCGDFKLAGLTKIYQDIHIVNTSIAERLRSATQTDSSINALILLDMYAIALPFVIEEALEEIQYLFTPFFGC